jgi:hypothetical protein
MCLAQNNDVIQTLSPDRSDQPFGKSFCTQKVSKASIGWPQFASV